MARSRGVSWMFSPSLRRRGPSTLGRRWGRERSRPPTRRVRGGRSGGFGEGTMPRSESPPHLTMATLPAGCLNGCDMVDEACAVLPAARRVNVVVVEDDNSLLALLGEA